MNDAGWTNVGADDTYRYAATILSVYWPEPEYHKLMARWPSLSEHLGVTWDEHRQRTERQCAFVDRAGHKVSQLPGDVDGFEAFLAGRDATRFSAEDLLAYPDLRTVAMPMVPWPPARTAVCWCGSGRRYKQCCRPHGLGTLD